MVTEKTQYPFIIFGLFISLTALTIAIIFTNELHNENINILRRSLGAAAIVLSVAAWFKEEHKKVIALTLGIATAAIFWEYVVFAVAISLVIIIISALVGAAG